MGYNLRKAAETIAYFIMQSGSYKINVLKAIKLVYLADRESLSQYGHPIQDEERFSLPHGPANSRTLNYLNRKFVTLDDGWSDVLTVKKNHHVSLVNQNIATDDFDELSLADIEILDQVWARFGKMTQFELSDWTHDPKNVSEWQDPGRSSKPISLQAILEAVGFRNPRLQAQHLKDGQEIDDFFNRL